MTSEFSDDLRLALLAADVADSITLPGYRGRSFSVERKPDRSEVTALDRDTESAIAQALRHERPHYSLFGEEHGTVGPTDARDQWVVDPIDGTSNFVRGVPIWATLIALVRDGSPVVGVVSAPALGRRWWATSGGGAFCDGARLRASTTPTLDEASASIGVTESWRSAGKAERLDAIQRRVARSRNYGDFWQHMLVAEGAVDLAIDAIGLGPYDVAALTVIVSEAGGRWSDRHGVPDWRTGSLITSNGVLHDEVLAAIDAEDPS